MIKAALGSARRRLRTRLTEILGARPRPATTREVQVLLALQYRDLKARGASLPGFDEVGFRVYSDNDEDGILLYVFSLVGTVTKRLVDIGCAGFEGSNTANLLIHHGWTGLLIDGREEAVKRAESFYRRCQDTKQFPPAIAAAWVTAENIDKTLSVHGITGEIDLLSIDIDGMDYWIWKAITCVTPRVVVVEYQDILGPEKALAVPYRPDFKLSDHAVNNVTPDYCGASLSAFVKLGRARGYRLVGVSRFGYNAFFIRSDVGGESLPEVSAASCFTHPRTRWGMEHRFPRVKDMEWIEV